MIKTLPLAAVFAALCIGFALPAQSGEDAGDPNMKFFYPDGSIQWEDDREFDRDFKRMEDDSKAGKDAMDATKKSQGSGQSPANGAAPKPGQSSY